MSVDEYRFSDFLDEKEKVKETINEDLGALAIGGVMSVGAKNGYNAMKMSDVIGAYDGLKLQQAVADFFTNTKEVTDGAIEEHAQQVSIPLGVFKQAIYDQLFSLWNQGQWNVKGNIPFDAVELNLGIQHEMKKCANPIIATLLAKFNLSNAPTFYSKLLSKEPDIEENLVKKALVDKYYKANQTMTEENDGPQRMRYSEAIDTVKEFGRLLEKSNPDPLYRLGYTEQTLIETLADGSPKAIKWSIEDLKMKATPEGTEGE